METCVWNAIATMTFFTLIALPVKAEESTNSYSKELVVTSGRASQQIGNAGAASEGSVAGEDLVIRPLPQVAELLEAVPGMVAVQHSGSGKANQYFLRGFNLDPQHYECSALTS